MLVLVTLVAGLYFACAGPTRNTGVADVSRVTRKDSTYLAPLLVTNAEEDIWIFPDDSVRESKTTQYYFWFFGGMVVELPYRSKSYLPAAKQLELSKYIIETANSANEMSDVDIVDRTRPVTHQEALDALEQWAIREYLR